jgi:hypothetical protein
MAKPPQQLENLEQRPFQRAALCGRLIGMAALTFGALCLYSGREASTSSGHQIGPVYIVFAMIFMVPGALYLVLATFVARQRRWAIISALGLAMVDMTLLGILFVTSWGTRTATTLCPLAGMFVVTLAVLTHYLGRCLEARKRMARI